ncbi:hypothetical protein CC85DRAFT_327338 [Cutaneotrichosporon oleaginosum]|uniref:Uncharacterized protein n=1 Tax=Cutaneotrichosporon oleaginosum TaxID=879819 RepID=A0A0J0XQN5_9TREE|nr:uncharacterized protein CC85DRAFT_327338 [Cutaneotrichosporon oleaginosum]KLT43393.1 hypothetical protein CC85DRAFT_327338 [Cutaneotrichosporon oleaginosum]TXT05393.1 hypothetical protein COLE_06713 [Cutaneotrichosporon oleaginosum]
MSNALASTSTSIRSGPSAPMCAPSPHPYKASLLIDTPDLQLVALRHLPFAAADGPPLLHEYEPLSAASTPESPGPPTPQAMSYSASTPRQPWTGGPLPLPLPEYAPIPPSYPPTPSSPSPTPEHMCGNSFDFATNGMSVSRAGLSFILLAWSAQNTR